MNFPYEFNTTIKLYVLEYIFNRTHCGIVVVRNVYMHINNNIRDVSHLIETEFLI